MNDVASPMRLVNTDTKLRICTKQFCLLYERCSISDAFSEYRNRTAIVVKGSSVSCTNDVALVAFSEYRNRTAVIRESRCCFAVTVISWLLL